MRSKTRKTLRIISRLFGTVILAFLLFFLIAHLFGSDESGEGFRSIQEIVMFICFPISATLGLILALKWPGIGGWIIIVSMLIFYIMEPGMLKNIYMGAVTLAGILYVLSSLKRRTIYSSQ